MIPERSNTEACTKISLPPRSGAMKPNPCWRCTTSPSQSPQPWSDRPRDGMRVALVWDASAALASRARIHAEDLRHLRPLRARAGTHLERRPGRHAAVATALNYAHMEECIAGTVGQLDEAEAFVRVVPLDSSSNRRAGGVVELWTTRRCVSEIASWWLVAVVAEITAAARAKITVTAIHGGTSFSTLRRYSVDHTIRALPAADVLQRRGRPELSRGSDQAAHAAAVGAKRCKRFGETCLDRSFPMTDFRIPAAKSDRKARAVLIET